MACPLSYRPSWFGVVCTLPNPCSLALSLVLVPSCVLWGWLSALSLSAVVQDLMDRGPASLPRP